MANTALDGWRRASDRNDPILVLMGVTPELCRLQRGSGSRLVAIDRSLDMIRSVWPGPVVPGDRPVCATWEEMPLAGSSVDIVVGDGALTTLTFPEGYARVCEEIHRVLRVDGRWVVRSFVQPDAPESVEAVLTDLAGGRPGGFHAFKWRVAMALQENPESGVAVADVRRMLLEAESDVHTVAARCGWSVQEVRTIEAYRGLETRYTFPGADEIRMLFRSSGFEIVDVVDHSYELGDRCPTYVLVPRKIA